MLLVNKPLNWTSFDVVNKLKMLVIRNIHNKLPKDEAKKIKVKIGHAGTLDPLATGLLIVCVGKQTKQINNYIGLDKTYTGSFYLGATTPSFDHETSIDNNYSTQHITQELIEQAALEMTGAQAQVPPVFSAIKKDGKRAYIAARAGEELLLEPRQINIISFEITEVNLPLVNFKITCSKGTYIRAIARDFGKKLNSGAFLNSLCRTEIGTYKLDDAFDMETLINAYQVQQV